MDVHAEPGRRPAHRVSRRAHAVRVERQPGAVASHAGQVTFIRAKVLLHPVETPAGEFQRLGISGGAVGGREGVDREGVPVRQLDLGLDRSTGQPHVGVEPAVLAVPEDVGEVAQAVPYVRPILVAELGSQESHGGRGPDHARLEYDEALGVGLRRPVGRVAHLEAAVPGVHASREPRREHVTLQVGVELVGEPAVLRRRGPGRRSGRRRKGCGQYENDGARAHHDLPRRTPGQEIGLFLPSNTAWAPAVPWAVEISERRSRRRAPRGSPAAPWRGGDRRSSPGRRAACGRTARARRPRREPAHPSRRASGSARPAPSHRRSATR